MVWDLILTRGSQVQFLSKNLTATCKLYAWLEMHQHRGWVSLHRSLSHWWFMVKLNLFKKGTESGQDSLFATGNSKQQIGLKPFIPQHKRRRGDEFLLWLWPPSLRLLLFNITCRHGRIRMCAHSCWTHKLSFWFIHILKQYDGFGILQHAFGVNCTIL